MLFWNSTIPSMKKLLLVFDCSFIANSILPNFCNGSSAHCTRRSFSYSRFNESDQSFLVRYSSNETGFEIERKLGPNGTYAKVTQVGVNLHSYSNVGLTTGSPYFFRVRAVNSTNTSAYSNESGALTLPKPPTGLLASVIFKLSD